jgi:hypothetical protein
MSAFANMKNMVRSAAHQYVEARRRREVRRIMERLPPHILKDIGYRDPMDVSNTM